MVFVVALSVANIVEVGVACDNKALRLIGKINKPAFGVFRESKEDTTGSTLKLLLKGNDCVAEHRFVAFEEGWTTKDTKASTGGLVLVAELI